jgi:hypothetical protein
MYHKTTPQVALFASAYLYYSNPTTSSTTNYLPISKFNKTPLQKVWMTEKKSMLILHTMPSSKRKGDGINFPLDGSNWPKKNPKYSCIKVWIKWTYCGQR